MLRLFALTVLLALGGCAAAPGPAPGPAEADAASAVQAPAEPEVAHVEAPPPPPEDLWERIRRRLTLHTLHNERIGAARDYYLSQPRYMHLIGPRAQRYLYYLVQEVESRGLPVELALLPLVESALDPFARSEQRAAGLWQIMPGTADDLGMRRDWWYDARYDLHDSTAAALDYLEDLNAEFDGDWLLALAAYNSGKARVRRAQRQNSTVGLGTDYWSLRLPRETRHYVPRLVALSTLIAFDRALEIELPPVPNQPVFTAVDTGGQIEMLRVAEMAGMELMELRRFNPGQLRWATAPGGDDRLFVPLSVAPRLSGALAALPDSERVTWQHYRIRRGDSLIRVAQRFDTEVALLREVNNIRGNLIRAGDTLMIPNSAAWQQSLALSTRSGGQRRGYTVRSGDSLYVIAQRFDVSIDDIITWNKLDPRNYLQPGQSLTLYLDTR